MIGLRDARQSKLKVLAREGARMRNVRLQDLRRSCFLLCQVGKGKKLVLTACMRRWLTILNAMLKSGAPWRVTVGQDAWQSRQLLTPFSSTHPSRHSGRTSNH